MIDDIRVKVTVMIDLASRTQGEMPKKTKNGDTQRLSHVAKSDVAVDKINSVNSQADHRYSFVPRPSRRLASRATPTERGRSAYHVVDCHITQGVASDVMKEP